MPTGTLIYMHIVKRYIYQILMKYLVSIVASDM
jgi:hypothetical protein